MLFGPCHPTQVCTVRVESRYETVSGRDSAFAIGYAPTNILTRTEKDGNGSALRAFLFLSLAQASESLNKIFEESWSSLQKTERESPDHSWHESTAIPVKASERVETWRTWPPGKLDCEQEICYDVEHEFEYRQVPVSDV